MSFRRQNVLVDLECLLDTRYGVLQRFGDAFRNGDTEGYIKRPNDAMWDMFSITKEQWSEAWGNRCQLDLEASLPTVFLLHLSEVVSEKHILGLTSPVHEKLKLYVNVAPYQLSNAVKASIKEAIHAWINPDIEVNMVNIPHELLTPGTIKDNYDSLFIYSFESWLLMHYNALQECRIPAVTFQVPLLVRIDDDINPDTEVEVDPVVMSKQILSEYLDYDPLGIEFYSIPHPLADESNAHET